MQIALREWRAFGQPVVYPDTELPFDNERLEGLWQRVGEYWWLGLPMGSNEQGLTGKHDQNGIVFPAADDGRFAWSAAFVSYVMRMAGAGNRFPYAGTHADYINAARLNPTSLVVSAEPPETYAPQRGDLICLWRGQPCASRICRPAGSPAIATSSSRQRPVSSMWSAAMSIIRCRCGTSRSRSTEGWSERTEESSIPTTRILSCCGSGTARAKPAAAP